MLRAHPLTFGPLPEPMQALTQQVKAYERLTIEAAVHGDRRSGLLALIANPLVGNANPAQPLLDEVLTINAPYLPQFVVSGYTQPDRGSARRTHFFSRNSGVGRW